MKNAGRIVSLFFIIALLVTGCGQKAPEAESTLPSSTPVDSVDWLEQAQFLTVRLVEYCFDNSALNGYMCKDASKDEALLLRFAYSFAIHEEEEEYYAQQTALQKPGDDYGYLSIDAMRDVLRKCFDAEEWIPPEEYEVEPDANVLRLPLAVGPHHPYTTKNMEAAYGENGDTIDVCFELEDSGLWPSSEKYGEYILTFSLMQENNTRFLRFKRMQPVDD